MEDKLLEEKNIREILYTLENFKFPKNYNRNKISYEKFSYSITFGRIQFFRKYFNSKYNKIFPEIFELLQKFLQNSQYSNFKYTTITINKNFKCKPHKDINNIGNSLIIGLGNYINGNLNISNKSFDIHNKFLLFDGSKNLHYVEDFEGNRYTIIYYNM